MKAYCGSHTVASVGLGLFTAQRCCWLFVYCQNQRSSNCDSL